MNTPSNHNRSQTSPAKPRQRSGVPLASSQRYDYYLALAREQARAGDRVQAENYYQHAEHFFRAANSNN